MLYFSTASVICVFMSSMKKFSRGLLTVGVQVLLGFRAFVTCCDMVRSFAFGWVGARSFCVF